MLHKTRECWSTADDERQRASRPSFGIRNYRRQGIGRVDELLELAESDATFQMPPRQHEGPGSTLEGLDKAIDDLETKSPAPMQNEVSLLDKVPASEVIASVIAASVRTRVFQIGTRFRCCWLAHAEAKFERGKQTLGA